MLKSHSFGLIIIALALGFASGWLARPKLAFRDVGRSSTMGDEHENWAKIPADSPQYATAQRLLGYNYYAHDENNLIEAKRHVDLALAASPNDPKVLEDAGRVYVMDGLIAEGTAMLNRADTPVALKFLASR